MIVYRPFNSSDYNLNRLYINMEGLEQDANMVWDKGPDELFPADEVVTWIREEGVRLRMKESGPLAEPPLSIITIMQRTVQKFGSRRALATKVDDEWKYYTYREYQENVRRAARAFIKLGLEAHHGVGIIGFNAPEWHIAHLAAVFAGGLATGIYTTNNPEACHFVAENAECNIIVVENDVQLQKFLEVRERLPHLKAIVQYKGQPKLPYPNVYSWEEMMKLGTDDLGDELQSRIKAQAPNKCCTLVYTSGTTGNPKGVMLSHDNITWTVKMLQSASGAEFGAEEVISYLPLSHVAAQMLDLHFPLFIGATVYFAQPDALKGSLGKTLNEVRPTIFLGVPRVWEKMQEAMVSVGKSSGFLKRSIASWAKNIGLMGNISKMKGENNVPLCFGLANRLVFQKVRSGLGFDRCKYFICGAAPIMKETLEFFLSLNIPIMEVYGMSETSGPHTLCLPTSYYITSVGKEFPGASTLLANPDSDGNGEVCIGGRHVFMGYLNSEEKTREAVDRHGLLHSGDIGRKDANGFLYITGRIKELLITAGGENVPPIPIEDRVKEVLPCISNCMLVGDRRKFLSMILAFKTTVSVETGEPLDDLTSEAVDWCRKVGSSATKLTEIIRSKDAVVLKAIQQGIDTVNKAATSRAQNIQKWSIAPRDFSVHGGELGPTLKLKRPVVQKMYSSTIDSFYADSE